MADATLRDVLDSVNTLARRVESLANEVRAGTDRAGQLEARITSVTTNMLTLSEEVRTVKRAAGVAEKTASDASDTAKKAMISHHTLEEHSKDLWSGVMAKLEAQDRRNEEIETERKIRESYAEEERKRESLAVKRIAEENRAKMEKARIWAPVLQAITIAALTAVTTFLAARAAHEDTEQKLRDLTQKISQQAPGAQPGAK